MTDSSAALAADPALPRCPACGAAEVTHLWRASSAEAAQHFVLREADPERHEALRQHIEALWRGPSCEVMECLACGFGFAWPYVAGGDLFYDLAYPHPDYPPWRWEYDRTLDAIRHLSVVGAKALEIGAGFGMFSDRIPAAILPRSSIVAVEYNPTARETLNAKGYRTVAVDIRNSAFPAWRGPFDFVFMFQVLEHMDRLDALFSRLHDLTAPGGHIFIAAPNPERTAFNERHGALLDMPPNHIGRWTITAYESVAARHGFQVSEVEMEPCRLFALFKEDAISHYQRQAQKSGSVANWVRRRRRTRLNRLAENTVGRAMAPWRLPVWLAAARERRRLGGSLWVHLRKEACLSA